MLVVMGGPMGVYDDNKYPWLIEEKKFIEKAIVTKKKVIGICLGAQLIACVLGSKVYKNNYKEIGWFDIEKTSNEFKGISDLFPQKMKVFHWHGDTYDIPQGAMHILKSEACVNQAFVYKDKVLALQFHLEVIMKNIKNMIKHCKNEIIKDLFIQDERSMLRQAKNNLSTINDLMYKILAYYNNKED
jgi:GMP synthase (glutamine-hydrolysing)